ncbi:MAG: phosphoglucosamine mutase, partial [Candidatus Diapherotrites archaeon]|nr:phosphoglucosamine mutase [Candidatus Diapherotrites archaeon]
MGKLFGTDGIRATANVYPMVPELALVVGKAVAHYFKEKSGNGIPKIVIGKDTRLSGYMIESALTSGIVSMGANVLLVGPMPTPAIAHLTKSLNADAGIVISASHNPSEDNGIKIFDEQGYKLDEKSEQEIETLILEEKMKSIHAPAEKIGKATRIDDAKGRYIEFAKASIKSESLEGLKIILDCANGAAYDVAPKIFSELGAEVIVIGNKPDGHNINLKCGATHPEEMQKKVVAEHANVGIALDGDADRVIVSDEKGQFVDGDHILAICANNLK